VPIALRGSCGDLHPSLPVPLVRRHLAERKHGGASQKWGSWVASSVLKELTISLNPKLQLGYRNPRCRGAAETVTQGRSSRLEFRSLMPGSQLVRCSLVRRMGWVRGCAVWIGCWRLQRRRVMKSPSRSRGLGLFVVGTATRQRTYATCRPGYNCCGTA
jgi:hypothetical protein